MQEVQVRNLGRWINDRINTQNAVEIDQDPVNSSPVVVRKVVQRVEPWRQQRTKPPTRHRNLEQADRVCHTQESDQDGIDGTQVATGRRISSSSPNTVRKQAVGDHSTYSMAKLAETTEDVEVSTQGRRLALKQQPR
uniref:Uncharacterized protein n=1 Tax=Lygus hesperus TaxID=30085 RepID=A0A146M8W5_LYGHE